MRVTALIVFLLVSISIACTGYAVYTDKVWYGMNFDYPPESDIRFSVSDFESYRIFTMQFFENSICDLKATKTITLGLNYQDHIEETGAETPADLA